MNLIILLITLLLIINVVVATSSTPKSFKLSKIDSSLSNLNRGGDALSSSSSPLLNTLKKGWEANKGHLSAAALARGFSIFCMFPVDTIKTRMQMGQTFSFDGLFNGVGSSLLGQIPYGVLTFGGYEIYKSKFTSMFPLAPSLPVYIAAAVAGDMTGSGWLVPSEVVKQNVQGGNYVSAGEAARSIFKSKGVGGFYQGYVSNCFRDVPFRVFQMVSYEYVKDVMVKAKVKRMEKRGEKGSIGVGLSSGEAAIAGAIAGSFSAGITTPLDVMKSKMMTGQVSGGYLGALKYVVENEGKRALFKGAVPRVGLIGPSVAIFFVVYEGVKNKFS